MLNKKNKYNASPPFLLLGFSPKVKREQKSYDIIHRAFCSQQSKTLYKKYKAVFVLFLLLGFSLKEKKGVIHRFHLRSLNLHIQLLDYVRYLLHQLGLLWVLRLPLHHQLSPVRYSFFAC